MKTEHSKKRAAKQLKLLAIVEDFNFSPKGGIEGVLLAVDGERVQVNFGKHSHVAHVIAVGQEIEMTVEHDSLCKDHAPGGHSVYRFVRLESADGEAHQHKNHEDTGVVTVTGMVHRLNFTKHGEPNGVVLETGDFVHLKPDGMHRARLKIGQLVTAQGNTRPTWNGKLAIEAKTVKQASAPKKSAKTPATSSPSERTPKTKD